MHFAFHMGQYLSSIVFPIWCRERRVWGRGVTTKTLPLEVYSPHEESLGCPIENLT